MILLFVIVKKPNDYLLYAGITFFASVGANLLNFLHAKKYCQIKLVKKTNWQYHLKPILTIFASAVAVTLYVSSDTTILGLLKGEHAVGIYSVSVRIYNLAEGLISGILVVTIPRLAMLLGKRRLKEYHIVLSKVINALSMLVLPVSVTVIMLSKEVILLIAGPKYLESVNSLRIITWAIIFSIFSWIFNQCVLIPAKRENLSLRNTLITGIVNVALNFILIPIWSYDGTSLSTVIAEFMVMSLNIGSTWDIIKPIILAKSTVKNIISSVVGCLGIVVVYFICKLLCPQLVLRTILVIVISMIIYLTTLFLFKNEIAFLMLDKLKNRFGRK
ncbi:polysaccharide biosynthesis C-terminal domain-containing protein [Lactobacillus xujianguonis]|uniref:oligosaccharide flippase family protein n=2 Tax=Lactobacillaceae TaxID=33958 RepID=UPI002694174E